MKIPGPDVGFVRLSQIIGHPKADPPYAPIIPVSKATWWNGVKSGRFPKPIKLTARTTVWRVEDIQNLIKHPCSQGVTEQGWEKRAFNDGDVRS